MCKYMPAKSINYIPVLKQIYNCYHGSDTSERVNFNKTENKTKNAYYLVVSMHITAHDKTIM